MDYKIKIMNKLILLCFIISITQILGQSPFKLSTAVSRPLTPPPPPPPNKGMTWSVATTLQPFQNLLRAGCNGCNAYDGDTDCSTVLPVLCLIAAKGFTRPWYQFQRSVPYAVDDGGFYTGWTGGIYAITDPVAGSTITSKLVGDNLCKAAHGSYAQMAEHHDGYYISYMNGLPPSGATGPRYFDSTWDWSLATTGGWSGVGYRHPIQFPPNVNIPTNRYWTWINDQPNGNCN